jgi:hypothetical protein
MYSWEGLTHWLGKIVVDILKCLYLPGWRTNKLAEKQLRPNTQFCCALMWLTLPFIYW